MQMEAPHRTRMAMAASANRPSIRPRACVNCRKWRISAKLALIAADAAQLPDQLGCPRLECIPFHRIRRVEVFFVLFRRKLNLCDLVDDFFPFVLVFLVE